VWGDPSVAIVASRRAPGGGCYADRMLAAFDEEPAWRAVKVGLGPRPDSRVRG
jgi:hypothetical protein